MNSRFYRCLESSLGVQVFRHDGLIVYPEHNHSELAIVICSQGTVESTQMHSREVLHEGEVLFTNAGVPHSSRYCIDGHETRGVTLEFDASVLKSMGYTGSSSFMQARFLGKVYLPTALQMARQIEAESQTSEKDSSFMILAIAKQLLATVLREWPRTLVLDGPPERLNFLPRNELVRSIEIMHATPAREFLVPNLARRMHRSTSAFSRLFVRSTGISPYNYYRLSLIEHAAELLSSTDKSIKEIALTLGFSNISHFSNSFRSRFNLSPSAYRQHPHLKIRGDLFESPAGNELISIE